MMIETGKVRGESGEERLARCARTNTALAKNTPIIVE